MASKKRAGAEERRAYWIMVGPALALYLLVMAFPILLSIILSLSDFNGGRMFGGRPWGLVGLRHYARLAVDPFFWNALKNNLYIVLVSILGQIPLGFIFAYLIYRRLVRGPGFWQGILYLPNILSVIVVGILWQSIFSPFGPVSEVFNAIYRRECSARIAEVFAASGGLPLPGAAGAGAALDGIARSLLDIGGPAASSLFADPVGGVKELLAGYRPDQLSSCVADLTRLLARKWTPDFMAKKDLAMMPILFVILWMYTGTYVVLFAANMQKIDDSIVESARIDGASEGQIMRRIILPALSGTIVNSCILAISGSLSSFALIFAMTRGGPARITQILSIYMYDNAFRGSPNYPLANAIALVMVMISLALIALTKAFERRFGGREE